MDTTWLEFLRQGESQTKRGVDGIKGMGETNNRLLNPAQGTQVEINALTHLDWFYWFNLHKSSWK